MTTTRHVSMITITLSTKELDKTSTGSVPPSHRSVGHDGTLLLSTLGEGLGHTVRLAMSEPSVLTRCRYQPPLPADQVKPLADFDYEGGTVLVFFSVPS